MDSATAPSAPRYFVAIPLPDQVNDRLAACQPTAAAGMRLIGRDEFHLTLHFLGEIAQPGDRTAVRNALAAIDAVEFSVTISGVGRFPPGGHAHVLWAGVQASPSLLSLHSSVGRALAGAIGWRPENRPYSPHVTLAHLDQASSTFDVDGYLETHQSLRIESVPIRGFALYSSTFDRNVPHYVEEASFRLGGV